MAQLTLDKKKYNGINRSGPRQKQAKLRASQTLACHGPTVMGFMLPHFLTPNKRCLDDDNVLINGYHGHGKWI